MFTSLAVLVTLRFKRIASIRVISQPYALQNRRFVHLHWVSGALANVGDMI